ncbi:carbohydrate kinase family protein [Candidatus Woesearchaeota archaeon]|nr:carbohydrate kinase family protein [Candidatus Woesearchaeota archaeon]
MKVAVIGPICRDTILIGDKKIHQMGSIPYYTCNALARLGVETTAIISCSPNEKDEWITEHFPGIEIVRVDAEGTIHGFIEYDDDPDVRKHRHEDPHNVIHVHDLPDLTGYDAVIMAPLLDVNTPPELFQHLADNNHSVVLGNFGMFTKNLDGKMHWHEPERLLNVLTHVETLFLDDREIRFVGGSEDIDEAATTCIKHGAQRVVVTLGKRGSHIYTKEKTINIPAYPLKKLVEPTGAGDSYVAGYIAASSFLDSDEERGKFAAMTATMSIERKGAFNGSKEEVLERLAAHR